MQCDMFNVHACLLFTHSLPCGLNSPASSIAALQVRVFFRPGPKKKIMYIDMMLDHYFVLGGSKVMSTLVRYTVFLM